MMVKPGSAFRRHPVAVRALMVCGVTVGVAGTAAAGAWAAGSPQGGPVDFSRLGELRLYPLAGSGLDPLSNSVGTNLSGIPLSTDAVSSMFKDGLRMSDLPVVATVLAPTAPGAGAAAGTGNLTAGDAAGPQGVAGE